MEVIQSPERAIRRQAVGRSLLSFPPVSEEETATIIRSHLRIRDHSRRSLPLYADFRVSRDGGNRL